MTTNTETKTIQITNERLMECAEKRAERMLSADYGAEYLKTIKRAMKREYRVHAGGEQRSEDSLLIETVLGRLELYAYVQHNYGKEPRVRLSVRHIDSAHTGRTEYLSVSIGGARAEATEDGIGYHNLYDPARGYGGNDRKVDEDTNALAKLYWFVAMEDHHEAIDALVAVKLNEMTQAKIDELQVQIDALKATLI